MPKQKPSQEEVKHRAVDEIAGLVDAFCREHLNEEYAELCRRLTEKLARKRPSPLVSGKPAAWACGIVRTIGMHNFLGDKSQKPHMKIADISRMFGVGESTAAARTATIRHVLRLSPIDFEWSLPSRADENPFIWLLNVNGLMMDIRDAPRGAQEVAFNKGLIPYIPADRQRGEASMAKKSKSQSPFAGRWRIVSMSAWEQDYIDEEDEGFFEFDEKGGGEFHFGYVQGQMDCRLTTRDGEPTVEWTWDGNDEMDPAQGRGWAVVKGDELHGMIFFHGGDDSEFVAQKKGGKKTKR